MLRVTRGFATLTGAAVAGFLIWLAAQMGTQTADEFWATYGLVAAAGLTMALSQVLGGWTKWGWPRLSLDVLLLASLPVAIVGLWVLFAEQPGDAAFATGSWSEDLGVDGFVSALGELLPALAFGVGLVLGFTFDTTGPRLEPAPGEPIERRAEPVGAGDARAADEPLTAERRADLRHEHDDERTRRRASRT